MIELNAVMPADLKLQQPTVGKQRTSFVVVVVASGDEYQPELGGRKSE